MRDCPTIGCAEPRRGYFCTRCWYSLPHYLRVDFREMPRDQIRSHINNCICYIIDQQQGLTNSRVQTVFDGHVAPSQEPSHEEHQHI